MSKQYNHITQPSKLTRFRSFEEMKASPFEFPSTKSPGQRLAELKDAFAKLRATYSERNAHRLNALEKLGEDVSNFRAEKTPNPKRSFFRLQRPKYTLDFLPEVPGLPRFREVFSERGSTNLDNIEVPYLNYQYLIQNKQALGRPMDQEDIRQLELKKQDKKPGQRRPRQRPH